MAEYRADASGAVAAVRTGAVLVVAGESAAPVAAELWSVLDREATNAVLERLTADGLGRTPDFAFLTWQSAGERLGSVRIIVRGAFEVVAGEVVVSGAAVSTWTERLVDDAERVEIVHAEASDATDATDGASWLPILDGVVAAAAVAVPGAAPTGDIGVAPKPLATSAAAAPANPGAEVDDVELLGVSEHTIAPVEEETIVGVTDFIRPPEATGGPLVAAPNVVPTPAVVGDLDETIARPVGEGVSAAFAPGDHDGMTVASADIRRLRAERDAARPATGAAPARPTPASPGVRVRMPDGSFEPLGHEIVLGRSPSVSKVSGGRLPRLVTIGHGDPDISRSHVRLALEGGTVVVTDLHSRNGTLVVAPGRAPVKLRAGEPTPVLIGTVVDLGGGWTIQVVGD
ncbi:FHA domain-containing protein [Agromyces italicus]|uniref:FHA domain-containing protein n=1 Tax=Agromyces italicus TaxID=279572 RepID=UPI0003B6FF98|nr:FHA domain-containing protein [Agromyces italicus]